MTKEVPLDSWVGSSAETIETLSAIPIEKLASTLGIEATPQETGSQIPPLAHWLYFTPSAPRDQLGADGHPKRGAFLPPVPLKRRMYAGGTIEMPGILRTGDTVTRRSIVTQVEERDGRSGPLVIVELRHEYVTDSVQVVEYQSLIYTDSKPAPRNSTTKKSAPEASWQEDFSTDEVLLFRFSALTFNSHRIHYDRTYAQTVEGYSDLVVHGPLIATLLARFASRHTDRSIARFSFRARSPLYVGEMISLRGSRVDRDVTLAAYSSDGTLAVEASATLG